MKTIAITVKGKVQGVGFRFWVLRHAREIGVSGFVKNLYNGNVYIEACGTTNQLELLVSMCSKGPVNSRVESVQVETIEDAPHFHDFQIVQ